MNTNKQTNEGQPAADKPVTVTTAQLESARDIERNRLKSAVELCEGRTIWNSDGTNGPCLICAPPKPADKPAPVKRRRRSLSERLKARGIGSGPGFVRGPAPAAVKLKAAWIRDDVPAGAPAPGRFDCECGRQVRAGFYGDGPAVSCECGLVYDNQGWIRGR